MDTGINPVMILRLKLPERVAVGIGILALIGAGYWYAFFGERQDEIAKLNNTIAKQTKDIAQKRRELDKLPEMRAALEQLIQQEMKSLKQLPSEAEIPNLLTDISNLGHELGLEFISFTPQKERMAEFYAEVPVDIKVSGLFHDVTGFLERLGNMSRIVNSSDLKITHLNEEEGMLVVTLRATTYRFIENKAAETKGKKNPKAKKPGKKTEK